MSPGSHLAARSVMLISNHRPNVKEVAKKEWKDFQTHARFSLFKASKKLGRKAEF